MGGIATKKHIKLSMMLAAVLVLMVTFTVPAFAITEAEVEAQVAASSKEAVTGNVLIWFLCTVSFLKVSQKIGQLHGEFGSQCRPYWWLYVGRGHDCHQGHFHRCQRLRPCLGRSGQTGRLRSGRINWWW